MARMRRIAATTAAVAFTFAAGASAQPENTRAKARTIEGTWRVQITLRDCTSGQPPRSPFNALASFARGGTVTTADGGLSPASRTTGLGVWWHSTCGTQGLNGYKVAEQIRSSLDQLPPTLRGVRERGTKPRVVFARHGCSVRGFGARADAVVTGSASGAGTAASSAAFARATAAAASSFARQHCLYLRPEPHGHGSFRPTRTFVRGIGDVSVPY
jgi:hypothetical protein